MVWTIFKKTAPPKHEEKKLLLNRCSGCDFYVGSVLLGENDISEISLCEFGWKKNRSIIPIDKGCGHFTPDFYAACGNCYFNQNFRNLFNIMCSKHGKQEDERKCCPDFIGGI